MFSWVDKVTTGISSLASFIRNPRFWFATVPATRIQFLYHFNWRLISQLLKGISSALQKLSRYYENVHVGFCN